MTTTVSRNLASSTLLTLLTLGAGALAAQPIPDQYIVVLKERAVAKAGGSVLDGPAVKDVASDLQLRFGGRLDRTFDRAVPGFVTRMTAAQAAQLAGDSRVALVEQDQQIELTASQLAPPSWGLDRIDQEVGLDGRYASRNDGAGVHVFVIDSGIRSTHQDFAGRVDTRNAFTTVADGLGAEDCQGHGTAVAGVVAGTTHGVAKQATLHSARVVDCNGYGATSDVIAAVDWITSLKKKGKLASQPFVVNLSLGGGFTKSLEIAINNSISGTAGGVTYVVAAGNNAGDLCAQPVLSLPQILNVGASDANDNVAAYSNFGACVDLYAPGTGITTAFNRGDADSLVLTGTSMAAPHVAGAAALYLADYPAALPYEVHDAVLAGATQGVLAPLADGSAPRMLFTPAGDDAAASDAGEAGTDAPPAPAFTATCNKRKVCTLDGRASSDDQGIVSWSWSLGDGASASGSRVQHTYLAGSYTVTLTVTDSAGQTASLDGSIVVP